MKRHKGTPFILFAAFLGIAVGASPIAVAYGMDCPAGMYKATDVSGNPICRGFSTGENGVTQDDTEPDPSGGMLPGPARWGTSAEVRKSGQAVPDYTPPQCPMGTYNATDFMGHSACKNFR